MYAPRCGRRSKRRVVKWIAARDRFYATRGEDDRASAIEAALAYRAALMMLNLAGVDDANLRRETGISS
jgi:hypothetical protein